MIESQVASKHAETSAKTTQLSNLEGHVKMAGCGVSLMFAAIGELKGKFADAKVTCYTDSGALRSAEVQLEIVSASETSLGVEVTRFRSDNTRLDD